MATPEGGRGGSEWDRDGARLGGPVSQHLQRGRRTPDDGRGRREGDVGGIGRAGRPRRGGDPDGHPRRERRAQGPPAGRATPAASSRHHPDVGRHGRRQPESDHRDGRGRTPRRPQAALRRHEAPRDLRGQPRSARGGRIGPRQVDRAADRGQPASHPRSGEPRTGERGDPRDVPPARHAAGAGLLQAPRLDERGGHGDPECGRQASEGVRREREDQCSRRRHRGSDHRRVLRVPRGQRRAHLQPHGVGEPRNVLLDLQRPRRGGGREHRPLASLRDRPGGGSQPAAEQDDPPDDDPPDLRRPSDRARRFRARPYGWRSSTTNRSPATSSVPPNSAISARSSTRRRPALRSST